MLDKCSDCGHDAHESYGCGDFRCGCDTMWTDEQARAQLEADED